VIRLRAEGEGVNDYLRFSFWLRNNIRRFCDLRCALWLWSSLTKTPDRLPLGPQKNLFSIFDDIHVDLKRQSKRNAWAAMAAAIAAAFQAALVFLPVCIKWPI
jgi:hypothetical protein